MILVLDILTCPAGRLRGASPPSHGLAGSGSGCPAGRLRGASPPSHGLAGWPAPRRGWRRSQCAPNALPMRSQCAPNAGRTRQQPQASAYVPHLLRYVAVDALRPWLCAVGSRIGRYASLPPPSRARLAVCPALTRRPIGAPVLAWLRSVRHPSLPLPSVLAIGRHGTSSASLSRFRPLRHLGGAAEAQPQQPRRADAGRRWQPLGADAGGRWPTLGAGAGRRWGQALAAVGRERANERTASRTASRTLSARCPLVGRSLSARGHGGPEDRKGLPGNRRATYNNNFL